MHGNGTFSKDKLEKNVFENQFLRPLEAIIDNCAFLVQSKIKM